jgi:hypothetical protein
MACVLACVRACMRCVEACTFRVCASVFVGVCAVPSRTRESTSEGARTDHGRQTEDVAECLGIAPGRDLSTTLIVHGSVWT